MYWIRRLAVNFVQISLLHLALEILKLGVGPATNWHERDNVVLARIKLEC